MPKSRSLGCIVASALTILAGIILLVTASIYINQIYYLHSLWRQIYSLSIFSLIIGIFAIIFGSGLIYVVYRQFPALTTLFSGSLILVASLAVICDVILLTGRDDIEANSYKNTVQLFGNYSDSNLIESSKSTVARVQQSYKCCGVERATYWESQFADKTSTPDSCCKKIVPHCGQGSLLTQDKIYLRGCAEPIYVHLRTKYGVLISMNFVILVLTLASATLGVIFERYIREQYQSM